MDTMEALVLRVACCKMMRRQTLPMDIPAKVGLEVFRKPCRSARLLAKPQRPQRHDQACRYCAIR